VNFSHIPKIEILGRGSQGRLRVLLCMIAVRAGKRGKEQACTGKIGEERKGRMTRKMKTWKKRIG
jgi:hypothetical protein